MGVAELRGTACGLLLVQIGQNNLQNSYYLWRRVASFAWYPLATTTATVRHVNTVRPHPSGMRVKAGERA